MSVELEWDIDERTGWIKHIPCNFPYIGVMDIRCDQCYTAIPNNVMFIQELYVYSILNIHIVERAIKLRNERKKSLL